ncbi:hypothetical protein JTB14_037563 [Gonioctena quinquepunctata]|nr:hypothetical protein JTB14_037563 [Gonioctena quinquepunctata]
MKVILVLVVFAIVEVSMGNDDENCTLPADCDRSLCPIPGCAQGSIYVDNDPCWCCPTCLTLKQKGEKCKGRFSNRICNEGLKCTKGLYQPKPDDNGGFFHEVHGFGPQGHSSMGKQMMRGSTPALIKNQVIHHLCEKNRDVPSRHANCKNPRYLTPTKTMINLNHHIPP